MGRSFELLEAVCGCMCLSVSAAVLREDDVISTPPTVTKNAATSPLSSDATPSLADGLEATRMRLSMKKKWEEVCDSEDERAASSATPATPKQKKKQGVFKRIAKKLTPPRGCFSTRGTLD